MRTALAALQKAEKTDFICKWRAEAWSVSTELQNEAIAWAILVNYHYPENVSAYERLLPFHQKVADVKRLIDGLSSWFKEVND